MAKLTVQQERFCLEYLTDFNATQAAVRAGYSEKTAYSQGQRLLKNVEAQKRLKELMSEKDAELIATSDEVLETLTRILRREEREHVVVTLKKRVSKYDKNGKKHITDTETAEAFEIPAKLSDVTRAAELLGKARGLYTEKVDVNVPVKIVIEDDYGGDAIEVVGFQIDSGTEDKDDED